MKTTDPACYVQLYICKLYLSVFVFLYCVKWVIKGLAYSISWSVYQDNGPSIPRGSRGLRNLDTPSRSTGYGQTCPWYLPTNSSEMCLSPIKSLPSFVAMDIYLGPMKSKPVTSVSLSPLSNWVIVPFYIYLILTTFKFQIN